MPYLIDGHNLIGQLPEIGLDDPNDEAQLVQLLVGFVARTNRKCTVVFDQGLPGGKSRMSTRAVQVVFASQRSSADKVMIDRIHKMRDPKEWIVVTSDNEVQSTAQRRQIQTITSQEFAHLLHAPPKPKIDAGEATNVHLSSEEVDEWLDIFGDDA